MDLWGLRNPLTTGDLWLIQSLNLRGWVLPILGFNIADTDWLCDEEGDAPQIKGTQATNGTGRRPRRPGTSRRRWQAPLRSVPSLRSARQPRVLRAARVPES